MSDLRIALIGAGAFGRKHIDVLDAVPGFTLAGIADPSPAARDLAAQLGVPWQDDPDALLAATRPDGAIVATPNALHLENGIACLRAGVPVLVEKPVADTPEAGAALADVADETGVPLLVGHHRRHNRILETAKAAIDEGRIGRPVAVHLSWLLRKPDSYFDVTWRRAPGGGPVLINLIHEIDASRFVVGEIAAVRALTSNALRDYPVEDTSAIALRFENGVLGTVIVSDVEAPWSWELTSGENPMYPREPAESGLIAGSEGSLSLPHLDLWKHTARPGVERGWTLPMTRERLPVPTGDAYQRQLRHFGRVIRGEEAPRVTARDAIRTLAVCLAVPQSASSGREVVLEGAAVL